jgi:hypothetical protein
MLITPEYKALQKQLHAEAPHYGVSGERYTDIIRQISHWGRLAILDYGCGKQTLARALGPAYRVTNYDPCIEGLDTPPEPHDVVACTDVMEHVEADCIRETLAELRRLTKQSILFVISVVPAQKVLADGRNAHISLYPVETWIDMIRAAGFDPGEKFDDGEGFNTFGLICR